MAAVLRVIRKHIAVTSDLRVLSICLQGVKVLFRNLVVFELLSNKVLKFLFCPFLQEEGGKKEPVSSFFYWHTSVTIKIQIHIKKLNFQVKSSGMSFFLLYCFLIHYLFLGIERNTSFIQSYKYITITTVVLVSLLKYNSN